MASKVSIDDVINAANLINLDRESKQLLVKKLEKLMQEQKDEKDPKAKKSKQQLVVILKSPHPINEMDVVASVVSIGEDEDPNTVFDTLKACAVDFNISIAGKKKKDKITTFSNIVNFLRPKFLRPRQIKVLNKDWSRCLVLKPGQDENFITTQAAKTEDFS